jgi:hypothetical protein
MAKKVIEPKNFYINSDKHALYEAKDFIYRLTVYEIERGLCMMVDNKETASKEFKFKHKFEEIQKSGKRYLKYQDLIAAPEWFIIKNKYFLKE